MYALVLEVTIRVIDGVREPKTDYLLRVMQHGSRRARLLKLADCDQQPHRAGVRARRRVRAEVPRPDAHRVLPYAEAVSPDMFRELSDLLEDRGLLTGRTD